LECSPNFDITSKKYQHHCQAAKPSNPELNCENCSVELVALEHFEHSVGVLLLNQHRRGVRSHPQDARNVQERPVPLNSFRSSVQGLMAWQLGNGVDIFLK
jgi:hypothetical protein